MTSIKLSTGEVIENVVSIEQAAGDVENIYILCGISHIFGPWQCEDCRKLGPGNHCGKWDIHHRVRSPLGDLMVETVDDCISFPAGIEYEIIRE